MGVYKFLNIELISILPINPSRPSNFLTMDILNELYHFDNFLHMNVLEIFNFNYTKVETTLSSMHRINFEKYCPLNF